MRLATADCETDPFKLGRPVHPFAWGLYDGTDYVDFWGDDATDRFLAHLRDYPEPLDIFAHNGGRFDWLHIIAAIHGEPMFIGSRLLRAKLFHHMLCDSYANIPVPLRDLHPSTGRAKQEIDYALLERSCRHRHKRKILDYQREDCVTLYDAMNEWQQEFGAQHKTMAAAAFSKLRSYAKEAGISLERLSEKQDAEFRCYYYGGRVETLRAGLITDGPFRIYDVTSMYPFAMKTYKHPISRMTTASGSLTEDTDFAVIEGHSRGALPVRSPLGGIDFPHGPGIFRATGHEIREAEALGLLRISKVREAITFTERTDFKEFVNVYHDARTRAKEAGNMMGALFYKLVLNSAYGKFALNPDKFEDCCVLLDGELPEGDLYTDAAVWRDANPERVRRAWRESVRTLGVVFWVRGSATVGRHINVATAASITGAARAVLMRGLANADDPIYCDTDSIICRDLRANLDGSELGGWKLEGEGTRAAIAGKKLYAIFDDRRYGPLPPGMTWPDFHCIKKASKGVKISPQQIELVASGSTVQYHADAPVMKLDGTQSPLVRTIRRTGKPTRMETV